MIDPNFSTEKVHPDRKADLTREELETALDQILMLQIEAGELRRELEAERTKNAELRSHLLYAEHELNRYLVAERDGELRWVGADAGEPDTEIDTG